MRKDFENNPQTLMYLTTSQFPKIGLAPSKVLTILQVAPLAFRQIA